MFLLDASPDGVIFDKRDSRNWLIRDQMPVQWEKSPYWKYYYWQTFYIALNKDKKPYLKEEHHFSHYSQIKFAVGLVRFKWRHFVVYVYNGMIIVKADFGRDYFKSVIDKMGVLHKLVIQ